jgi:hypothetical protein
MLREKDNRAPNLLDMMRKFKVPVGLTEEEKEVYREYYEKGIKDDRTWYQKLFRKRPDVFTMFDENEHSPVIFLMDPDNSLLQTFPIN